MPFVDPIMSEGTVVVLPWLLSAVPSSIELLVVGSLKVVTAQSKDASQALRKIFACFDCEALLYDGIIAAANAKAHNEATMPIREIITSDEPFAVLICIVKVPVKAQSLPADQ